MKAKEKTIRLTKREAVALLDSLEMAMAHFGPPRCRQCAKPLFSAVEKLDEAFQLGITTNDN